MNLEDTKAYIRAQFENGDIPTPGMTRLVIRATPLPGVPEASQTILQQEWTGSVSGKTIWVDVPTDAESDVG
mgnify:FL=1